MASSVYEVAFKIAASTASSFVTAMKGAGHALGEVNARLAEIGKQQAASKRVVDLRKNLLDATREFHQARQRVEELGAQMARTKTPTKALVREYQAAQSAVKKAAANVDKLRESLREAEVETGLAGRRTAELVREQERLAQTAARASKLQAALQKNVSAQQANLAKRSELRGQMMDVVALGAALGGPVKHAMDWEQKQAELNKVAGKTPEELARITSAAQKMAIETGVAREEILGAITAAAQAGFDEGEWTKYAEVASKMGVAFDTSGEAAGEMLKAWRSAMGLSMDDAEKLAAAANHIANNMNATAADVGEVLQRQGAVLRTAGLSSQQSAAFAASLLSSGATPEVAATAAKNIALALTKGAAATRSQRAALSILGIDDPARLAKAMQKDPEKAMMLVFERLGRLSEDQRVSVMGQLFGSETVGAVAPLVGNLQNLANAFGLVRNEADFITSLDEEFDAMGNTTQQQMKKAWESFKAISTELGATLLPTINQLLLAFSRMAIPVVEFIKENQELVGTIAKVAAALITFKGLAIGLGYVFTFFKGAWLTLRGVILAARVAMLLFNVAMLTNPITWVIAGIVALVAAGIWLWKNWDAVVEWFGNAWERIKEFFWTFNPYEWIREKLNILYDWLEQFSLFKPGVAILRTLTDGMLSMASKTLEAVRGIFSKIRDYLPFSDAKVGPLSDLTYSGAQVMETFSRGMLGAANAPLDAMASALPVLPDEVALGGVAGGMSITINQEIRITGGEDVYDQARRGAAAGAEELLEQLQRALARRERLSYG